MRPLTAFLVPALAALSIVLLGLIGGMAQAQQGYRVQPGDILGIEVLEDNSLNREVLILPDGSFTFPFAGTVRAFGRTPDQIAAALTSSLASNFANEPNVFVAVRTLRPTDPVLPEESAFMNIYILGEVNSPGPKEVVPGATLLQALSESGGFTNFAAVKRVQLRRTNPRTNAQTVTLIDYRSLANGAALSQDVVLVEGDVILVPQRRLFE
ncbi:MAG: polysaccharide biosynthesis/export family protein [Pseudomonadota bacterium]